MEPTTEAQQPKKRGRPRADKTTHQAENSRVGLEQDRVEAAHSPERPARLPMGATLKLEFGNLCDDPKYHFRVISERDGRIEQAKQAWYEHVKDHNGDNVVRHGGQYKQYLMKIEKKYWDQDQQLKQKKLAAKLRQEQVLKADEYIPDGHHHVLQKDDYDPLA